MLQAMLQAFREQCAEQCTYERTDELTKKVADEDINLTRRTVRAHIGEFNFSNQLERSTA